MQQAVALFQMMYLGWFEELLAAALGASNSTNQQTMHVIWTCNGKCDFYPVVYNPNGCGVEGKFKFSKISP